ncbi:MAG: phosphatase PAP2 family protein [Candidatus Nitrosocosmicus sp.]
MNQKSNFNINYNPFWNIKNSYILLFLLCFAIITVLTITGLVKNLDNFISDHFKNIIRNSQSDLLIIIITTISDTINLIIIGFILTIIKKTRRFGMILLISIVAITIVVTYVKPFFAANQSPTTFVFEPLVKLPDKFTLEKDSFMPFAQNYSYPSNHLASTTAFSFIIGGLIYKRSTHFAKGFMILFPAIIGFTKLYLLQQYFSDIVGGCILGLIISSLAIKLLKVGPEGKKNEDVQT